MWFHREQNMGFCGKFPTQVYIRICKVTLSKIFWGIFTIHELIESVLKR